MPIIVNSDEIIHDYLNKNMDVDEILKKYKITRYYFYKILKMLNVPSRKKYVLIENSEI